MPTKRASVAKKSAAKKKPAAKKKSVAPAKKGPAKKAAPVKKAAPTKKAAPKKAPAKSAASTKRAAPTKKSAPAKAKPAAAPAKKAAAAEAPAKKWGKRADLGAPITAFFLKQPPELRPILEQLRGLVEQAAPSAESSIKWGMPFYMLNGTMMCAIGAHKSHVNLILSGPPGTYADPDGLLAGDGKTGRHLKLTARDEVPVDAVRGWLRTAVDVASKG